MKNRVAAKICLGLIPIFLLLGCKKDEAEILPQVTIPEYEKATYEWTEAKKEDVTPDINIRLDVQQYERKSYYALYDDMEVKEVNASAGEKVKKGTVLLTFKSEDIEEQMEYYQKQVEQNTLLLEHYSNLDKLDHDKDKEVTIDQIRREIETDKVFVAQLREKLNSYNIIAEDDGLVFSIAEGMEGKTASSGISLVSMIYGDETYVADIDNTYDLVVGNDYEGFFSVSSYPMKLISMEEQENGKYKVKFKVQSTDKEFCTKDNLELRIHKDTIKGAIIIPKRCIFQIDDKVYAYVLDENGFRDIRELVIGDYIDDRVVIVSGINEGEKVVLQ